MFTIETTEENVEKNYNKFMEYINADPRADALKVMYDHLHDQLITAPASGKKHYHNCFPGGYLDHVLRVTENALKMASLYKTMEGDINFTKQELIFSALHHDLGKLGDPDEGPYYLDQDNDWRRKQGEMYKFNDNLQYFKVTDRALFTLNKFNIQVSQAETLAIKLSDGLYDEANKSYFINYAPYPIKTNLPYIIHWADHMACRIENDKTRF